MRSNRLVILPSSLFVLLVLVHLTQSCGPESRQIYTPVVKSLELPENALTNLSDAVRIPTISFDDGDPEAFDTLKFKAFHSFLEERYPLIHSHMSREIVNEMSLIYTWPGIKNSDYKPVLLLSHMDVVPVSDSTKWTHPPFSGAIDNEFVWGRGTLDDKASIIGIMEASEKLLEEGFIPQRSIYFAFGHDEEVGGRNGALEIARLFEERGVSFEYSLDEGGLVADGVVPGLAPPVALIGVAEKGYLSLELSVSLAGGHSSMPMEENSLVILSDAIVRLHNSPFPARIPETVDLFLDHIGPELSFFNSIAIANRWLFRPVIIRSYSSSASGNATIRTTAAPTIFQAGIKDNVIPASARAVVNFRLLPGTTREEVMMHLEKAIKDDRIHIAEYGNYIPPSPMSSHETDGYELIRNLARDHFDSIAVAPYLVIAGTDSRHYTEVTDNSYRFLPVQLIPGDLDRIHGIDERIGIENFQTMISFYYHFLREQ